MLVFIDCVHCQCHSVMFVHLNKLECVDMPPALHFSPLHLSLQCILWNKVFLVWKLSWSCSVFEMIICCSRFLSAEFGHTDYIILTFKAEFVCPTCSDFITSSYSDAPEALKFHRNGFSLYYEYESMTFTVSIVTNIHTSPDPSFDAIQHTLGSKPFFDDGNSCLKHTTF